MLIVSAFTVSSPRGLVVPKSAVKESQTDGGYDEGEHT